MVLLLKTKIHAIDEPTSDVGIAYEELSTTVHASYDNAHNYLVARLFILYIAAFEVFLQDIAIIVIHKDPKKVGKISFNLSEILDAANKEELIRIASERTLNDLMYKKPKEYLQIFCALLSIEQDSLVEDWNIFIEAKARRDIGVHNAWRCNETYLRKLSEISVKTNLTVGEYAIPADHIYLSTLHRRLLHLCSKIMNLVCATHWKSYEVPIFKLLPDQPAE